MFNYVFYGGIASIAYYNGSKFAMSWLIVAVFFVALYLELTICDKIKKNK
jgi:hypothetical protein